MAAAKARIIDADVVHPWINGDVKGLMPYLSTAWRRRFGLKVVAAEFGYSWIPHLLWRMDQNWREFRREVPWIVSEPSTLVLEHARFTSQPAEEPEKPEYLLQALEIIRAEETMLFSTDYPHWDTGSPTSTFRRVPEALRRRIFYDNAAELYGLGTPARA